MKAYKTLLDGMKSQNGSCKWKIGEWKKYQRKIDLCHAGYHCSTRIIDAMDYVHPGIIAEVETSGNHEDQTDKQVWSEMRIIRAWKWKKEDSVALAVYAAELTINNFEKVYPNDKRPREAIEAAKRWLKEPTEENSLAAKSAWLAARSVWSARSAWLAARSAQLAAESAVESAWSAQLAVRSARSAAKAVQLAYGETINKTIEVIESWIKDHLESCEEVK